MARRPSLRGLAHPLTPRDGRPTALAVSERHDAHERVPRVGVVRVLARSAVGDVVADDAVIGGHAEVPTPAPLHDVRPRVAPDRVAAGAALDLVVGASPRDEIRPPPTAEVVGARSPVDPILAQGPDDRSSPPSPTSASSPLRPQITSRLAVPRRTSFPFVPEIVHPDEPAGSS